MLGWRARIGVVIAHSNTTLEPEFSGHAPEGVSIHASRIHLGGISVADMAEAARQSDDAVRLLSAIGAGAIAYACNGASIAGGDTNDEAMQQAKIAKLAGAPAVLATLAVREALDTLGIRRIAVAAPYPDDLAQANAAYWRRSGIEVVNVSGIDLGGSRQAAEPFFDDPVSAVGLQEPSFAYHLARRASVPDAEATIVLGCNLRTFEVADLFEADHGIPLISSNLALLWACLQTAGVREPVNGSGRLLREQPPIGFNWIPRP